MHGIESMQPNVVNVSKLLFVKCARKTSRKDLVKNNELLSPTTGNRGERLRTININSVRKEIDTNRSVNLINSAGIKRKKTDVNDNRIVMQIKMAAGALSQLKKRKFGL